MAPGQRLSGLARIREARVDRDEFMQKKMGANFDQ
jgi:hypothetical protein